MHSAYSTFSFGNGSLPVNIAYVYLKGTESSLANCTYSTGQSSINRCLRYNDGRIGVQCRPGENINKYMSYHALLDNIMINNGTVMASCNMKVKLRFI